LRRRLAGDESQMEIGPRLAPLNYEYQPGFSSL